MKIPSWKRGWNFLRQSSHRSLAVGSGRSYAFQNSPRLDWLHGIKRCSTSKWFQMDLTVLVDILLIWPHTMEYSLQWEAYSYVLPRLWVKSRRFCSVAYRYQTPCHILDSKTEHTDGWYRHRRDLLYTKWDWSFRASKKAISNFIYVEHDDGIASELTRYSLNLLNEFTTPQSLY